MSPADRAAPAASRVVTSYDDLRSQEGELRLLLGRGERVVLDLGPPGRADLSALEVLARLALVARRAGRGRLSVAAERELRGLAALCGLAHLLDGGPVVAAPGGCRSAQPWRQPEPGEQLGAEEVVDVRDPPA